MIETICYWCLCTIVGPATHCFDCGKGDIKALNEVITSKLSVTPQTLLMSECTKANEFPALDWKHKEGLFWRKPSQKSK